MATAVQLPTYGDFPTLVIEDREDARVLCEILKRNDIPVNIREA